MMAGSQINVTELVSDSIVPNPIESNYDQASISLGVGGLSLTTGNTNKFTISGANTYTGSTAVASGTLSFASGASVITPVTVTGGNISGNISLSLTGSIPNNGRLTLNGGTVNSALEPTNISAPNGIILGASGGTFNVDGGNNLTITNTAGSNIISGSGSLTKTGANTLTFSGANANLYTGTTNVTAGTLALSKTGVVAIAGDILINGGTVSLSASNQTATTSRVTLSTIGSTFALNNFSDTIAGLSSVVSSNVTLGSGTLTLNPSTPATYSGVISGVSGNVTKIGSSTQTFEGTSANTYTGLTTVTAGTLALSKTGVVAIAGNVQIN